MWRSNRAAARIAAVLAWLAMPQLAAAAPGDFLWNRGWDASGFADMDETSETNAAGMFIGMMSFGGAMLNSANPFTGDVWVARYAANGAHQWSRAFTPGGMGVSVTAVTDAPSGSVYVAGTIIGNGTIDFGGGVLAGANQMWIVKFDELGNHLWSDTFGLGIIHSLDGDQNLLGIGGEFFGPIDFGGGVINPIGLQDAFIALIHGGMAHVWSAGFGDAAIQITKDVDVDVSGTLAAVGCFQGTVDFGGGNLMSNAVPDLFLARFDPTGAHLYSKNYPGNFGPAADVIAAVAQDGGAEHVALVSTSLNVACDFGGGPLIPLGGSDIVLAMFDELGAHQWSARYGAFGDDQGQDVAFDLGNNVVMTGTFQGAVNFGAVSGALTSNGGIDLFVSSWNTLGQHAWNRNYGTMNDDVLCRVVTDPVGNALLFGTADNGINFGGGGLPDAEIFLAKIRALNASVDAPVAAVAAGPGSFPNPFRDATTLRLAVPPASHAAIAVHDVSGRLVRTLDAGAGTSAVPWDGRDASGRDVPPGVYFWRVDEGASSSSGRVIRIR